MNINYPLVDILITNFNGETYLKELIISLEDMNYPKDRLNIIFVDNSSSDNSIDIINSNLKQISYKLILNKRNLGFTGGNNEAFKDSKAPFILILNVDIKVHPDMLMELMKIMLNDPKVGICDGKQYPFELNKYYSPDNYETSWCSGAASLIRREAIDNSGLFDERFYMFYEDVDLSWRMWLNEWKCIHVPSAKYFHYWTSNQRNVRKDYYYIKNAVSIIIIYGSIVNLVNHLWFIVKHSLVLFFLKFRIVDSINTLFATIMSFTNLFYLLKKRYKLIKLKDNWVNIKYMNVGNTYIGNYETLE